MQIRRIATAVVGTFLATSSAGLRGQETPDGTVFNYVEIKIKAGHNAQWENAWKQINAQRLKYNRPYPYSVWEGEDNRYLFLTPLKDLPEFVTGWQAANQEVTKQAQAAKDPPTPPTAQFQEYSNRWWLQWHPEWSYTPANPRLKPAEIGFVHWDIYYLPSGSVLTGLSADEETKAGLPAAATVLDQLAALYQTRGLPDGLKVYSDFLGIGPEVPFRIVSTTALDEKDFNIRRAQIQETLGLEGLRLLARLASVARRIDSINFKIRRDLSYRWGN